MRKIYLFVYCDSSIYRTVVKAWADESELVSSWRYDIPNSIYLVSEASADELSAEVTANFGSRFRFLITEVSENRQGCMPADTWYFLLNKRTKSMEESASRVV